MDDNGTCGLPEAADHSTKLASQRNEIHSLWNSRSWRIFRPLRNLIRELGGRGKETEPIAASVEEAARIIATIRHSLSWRLTGPLRMVHRAVLLSRTATAGDANHQPHEITRRDDTLGPALDPAGAVAESPALDGAVLEWNRLDPIIERQALRFSVASAIHPADHIFRFIMEHPRFNSDEERVQYYFEDGANSARQFTELLRKYCGQIRRRPQVLEFASGYGCVTRHLVLDSGIDLESCDIHPAAIDFLQTRIGVRTLQSSPFPETVSFPHQFDFVFALSFFSHMPITTWTRWLVRLTQSVRPGGAVAFTTRGVVGGMRPGDPEIPEIGFRFMATSEQLDLPTEEYGSMIVTETFVRRNVLSIPCVELVETRPAYWWRRQDLYVLRKTG
jgi:hypothetical protein